MWEFCFGSICECAEFPSGYVVGGIKGLELALKNHDHFSKAVQPLNKFSVSYGASEL